MIDKLKQKNADMDNVINTEKFKTMKQVEGELRTALTHNKSLIAEVTQRNTEKVQLESELKHFTVTLEKFTEDYEKRSQDDVKVTKALEDNQVLHGKINELERTIKFKAEELSIRQKTVDDLLKENESINNDVDYFKNMAKTTKIHADKAIADIEVYRQMLMSKSHGHMNVEY